MNEYTIKLTLADGKQRIVSVTAKSEKDALKWAEVTKTEVLWKNKVRT